MDLSESRVTAAIAVSDLARAREFYEQKLGLRPSVTRDGEGYTKYGCGHGTFIQVFESPNAGSSRTMVASWWVNDMAAMVSTLAARGVPFIDRPDGVSPAEDGGVPLPESVARVAYFTDPDGNLLALTN